MIDTIRIQKEDLTKDEYKLLLNSGYVTEIWDKNPIRKMTGLKGEIRNLKIYANDTGKITIEGSFDKFFNGDNQQTLSFSSDSNAVDLLASLLPINLLEAEIKAIDISENILVKDDPKLYWELFGKAGRYIRNENNNGVTYKLWGSNKEYCVYGKIREQKQKREKINAIYTDNNLLRLELRFKNRIEEQFGRKLYLADLKKPEFYIELVTLWKEAYDSISKYRKPILQRDFLKGSKVFDQTVLSEWIETNGGELAVLDMIDRSVKYIGKITKSEQQAVFRHKYRIKEICRNPLKTETVDLIKELDEKVNIVAEFHRALL